MQIRRRRHIVDITLLKAKARRYGVQLDPEIIQSDFESAILNAASTCFPCTSLRRCYFHFTYAIWRAVQRHKLIELLMELVWNFPYKNEEGIEKMVMRALKLLFLPTNKVDDVWMGIASDHPQPFTKFVNCVTEMYVDETVATFFCEIGNHFYSGNGIRTNNYL